MGIPVLFVLFLILIITVQINLRKYDSKRNASRENFWEKEHQSLFSRKKPLDSADFISASLPDHLKKSIEVFKELDREDLFYTQEKCFECLNTPMMNLENMLNSDVRIKYGTANLETVELYEENYNKYLHSLYMLGKGYYELKMYQDAITVLEEGVRIHTQMREHYIILGKIYKELHQEDSFKQLIRHAEEINSISKSKLIKALSEL